MIVFMSNLHYGHHHSYLWHHPLTHRMNPGDEAPLPVSEKILSWDRPQGIQEQYPLRSVWESPASTSQFSICTQRYGIHRKMMWLYHLRWTLRMTLARSHLPRTQEWKSNTQCQWTSYQGDSWEKTGEILRISDWKYQKQRIIGNFWKKW